MIRYLMVAAAFIISTNAAAHEMTPTYPVFKQSFVAGVSRTTLKLWNRRDDASYYEFQVYDENWKPIKFATERKIVKILYLQSRSIDIYVREGDVARVEFICSKSRLLKKDVKSTGINSRVCSRVK